MPQETIRLATFVITYLPIAVLQAPGLRLSRRPRRSSGPWP